MPMKLMNYPLLLTTPEHGDFVYLHGLNLLQGPSYQLVRTLGTEAANMAYHRAALKKDLSLEIHSLFKKQYL